MHIEIGQLIIQKDPDTTPLKDFLSLDKETCVLDKHVKWWHMLRLDLGNSRKLGILPLLFP